MKRIALVATGGTIAGRADSADDASRYTAGVLSATDLLATVPGIERLAAIVPESPFAIDSKDITPAHWLKLAQRLAELINDPAIDGIVVTHGTDTLEETAWLLHLTLPAGKPVVLTGAMRPANALDADGPANLYQAVALAASGITAALGVVVAIHGDIHGARDVAKRHTQSLDAFASPGSGPLGRSDPPHLTRKPSTGDAGFLPLGQLSALPEIPLIDVPGGALPIFLQVVAQGSARSAGAPADMTPAVILERGSNVFPGVVLALPGNGSLPDFWQPAVEAALAQGIVVVRASRTSAGRVDRKIDLPGLAAGTLTPPKARIALMLALASGRPDAFEKIADLA